MGLKEKLVPGLRDYETVKAHTLGIGFVELDVWRDSLVLQGKDRLDQAVQSRSTFRMTDVRLDGTDVHALFTQYLAYGRCLNRITGCGSGSVALHLWSAMTFVECAR